jgi:hypothetical protein
VAVWATLAPFASDAFTGDVGHDRGGAVVVHRSLSKSLAAWALVNPAVWSDVGPVGSLPPFVICHEVASVALTPQP